MNAYSYFLETQSKPEFTPIIGRTLTGFPAWERSGSSCPPVLELGFLPPMEFGVNPTRSTALKGAASNLLVNVEPDDRSRSASKAEPPAIASLTGESPDISLISLEEIQRFMRVVPQMQEIEQAAEQAIIQVITDSDLNTGEFVWLCWLDQWSDAHQAQTVSTARRQSVRRIIAQVQTIEQETERQQQQLLQTVGLDPERFDQIMLMVLQDPTVRDLTHALRSL